MRPRLRAAGTVLRAGFAVALAAAGLLAVAFPYDARGPAAAPLPAVRPDLAGHRILVLASPGSQEGSWHGLQHRLPAALGAWGAKGLFVEASPFSRRVFELESLATAPGLRPHWWAIRTLPREALAGLTGLEVAERFAELGVDAVVAREPVSEAVAGLAAVPAADLGEGYSLYRLPVPRGAISPDLPWIEGPAGTHAAVSADGREIRLVFPPGAAGAGEASAVVRVNAFPDWRVESGEATLEPLRLGFPGTGPFDPLTGRIEPDSPAVLQVRGRGEVILRVAPRAEEWAGFVLGGAGALLVAAGLLRRPRTRTRAR